MKYEIYEVVENHVETESYYDYSCEDIRYRNIYESELQHFYMEYEFESEFDTVEDAIAEIKNFKNKKLISDKKFTILPIIETGDGGEIIE